MLQKLTCLMFGEGKNDRKFIDSLRRLPKFKYWTKNWIIRSDAGRGCSASDILNACKKSKTGAENLVICFIDLDDLKNDYKSTWEKQQKALEEDALKNNMVIIWFINNAEEEFKKVLGAEYQRTGKHQLNKVVQKRPAKFINSPLWNRILAPFKSYERGNPTELKEKGLSPSDWKV